MFSRPPKPRSEDDNPDGVLDDAAIAGFLSGIKDDRIAFLDGFTVGFFSAGGELNVSEVQRVYARDITAFASPKATLDCVTAFGATDFRPDLAKFSIPTPVGPIHPYDEYALADSASTFGDGPGLRLVRP